MPNLNRNINPDNYLNFDTEINRLDFKYDTFETFNQLSKK